MDPNENSDIHQKVMAKAEKLHDIEKFDWGNAARLAIKHYKPVINANILLEHNNDPDDESLDDKASIDNYATEDEEEDKEEDDEDQD